MAIPFILLACLLWWELPLLLLKSGELAVITGPAAFCKCHINCNTVKKPHYHPKKFCRHVLRSCGVSVPAFIMPGCACHSSSVHQLATASLGFYYIKNLFRSSSLSALSHSLMGATDVSYFQQKGCLGLSYQFDKSFHFLRHGHAACPLLLNFKRATYVYRFPPISFSLSSKCFDFLKTLISILKWFLSEAFKLAEFVSLLIPHFDSFVFLKGIVYIIWLIAIAMSLPSQS